MWLSPARPVEQSNNNQTSTMGSTVEAFFFWATHNDVKPCHFLCAQSWLSGIVCLERGFGISCTMLL